MDDTQDSNEIKKVAMDFDNAIEAKNMEDILAAFSDDCKIELFGVELRGKEGVTRWVEWLYNNLSDIKFTPILIMVEDGVFFEEFVMSGMTPNDERISVKMAEVLVYEDYKIRNLRIYLDRLEFAEALAGNFLSRGIVGSLVKRSEKGLV
jgi:hypothetical protein